MACGGTQRRELRVAARASVARLALGFVKLKSEITDRDGDSLAGFLTAARLSVLHFRVQSDCLVL